MRFFSFLVATFLFCNSHAKSDVIIKNDHILLTGKLDHKQQLTDFKAALIAAPEVKIITLEQCLGGTAGAAVSFAELVKDRKLATIAKGNVSSACAIVFMAGSQRRFSTDLGLSFLLFHAARQLNSSSPAFSATGELAELLASQTGKKLKPHIEKLISTSFDPNSGVVFLNANYFFFKIRKTLYCDGSQGANLSLCSPLDDADVYENGILTKP